VLGVLALGLVGQLLTLPFAVHAERVLRSYGLSTQDWRGWAMDRLKGLGVGLGLTILVLLGLYALMRAAPRTWWAWSTLAGALLVFALSFAYPVLLEPLFNTFTPMPAGPLRDSLLQLAAADDVAVGDVLVADASRRTTALNAYVSGLGATRRIVVYDTLVDTAPDQEVRLVVAHELGHAKRRDVLTGTGIGALALGVGSCALYLLLTWPALLRRAGVSTVDDPRSVALLLAVVALGGSLLAPAQALVSRRIEARADVHSLDLTGEPDSFVAMEHRLSVTNLSDLSPHPLLYAWYFSHPTAPQRIALARDWQRHRAAESVQ
jgi:STE24 endopeptidase